MCVSVQHCISASQNILKSARSSFTTTTHSPATPASRSQPPTPSYFAPCAVAATFFTSIATSTAISNGNGKGSSESSRVVTSR